jgi:hypothetical protein
MITSLTAGGISAFMGLSFYNINFVFGPNVVSITEG